MILVNGFKYKLADINQYFDHRYRASNARNANNSVVVNNDFPASLKDEIGTVDLPLGTSVSNIGTSNHLTGQTIPYRSQFGGYVQMYNQTGSYFGGVENVIGTKPFPRYRALVGVQTKYNTFEALYNPYRGSFFGDFGDAQTRIEGGDPQYNPTIGIPYGFPIRQAYLLEVLETLEPNGNTVRTKIYFNGTYVGENTGGVDNSRQSSPVLQIGTATTNNANWGCIDMMQKWGVPTEAEIAIIRNTLTAQYRIGQRINAPLALDLLAVKDGNSYTAYWNYSPNPATQLPMQEISLKWVIYKEPDGVQSSIYFGAVDNLTTWNSETYPLPSGFTVRGLEAIVKDTAGNFCNIPERVNTSTQ